jgi:hypothetical protein
MASWGSEVDAKVWTRGQQRRVWMKPNPYFLQHRHLSDLASTYAAYMN